VSWSFAASPSPIALGFTPQAADMNSATVTAATRLIFRVIECPSRHRSCRQSPG
jgi:hypothetical protein